MRSIAVLAILCTFAPTIAVADDAPTGPERASTARRVPAPQDIVAPGVLRQDLFNRNNPNNLRHDYPAPPGQPG
jgi:hypothetical protein